MHWILCPCTPDSSGPLSRKEAFQAIVNHLKKKSKYVGGIKQQRRKPSLEANLILDMSMSTSIESGRMIDRSSSTGIFVFPPEILSAIFERGKEMVDTNSVYGEGRVPPDESFEWLVSRTCPVFRSVALATPTLWTSLQFNGSWPLAWIEECIKRSGSCPLDIDIDDGFKQEHDGKVYLLEDAAILIITAHSYRWRSLSMNCANERIVSRICHCRAPRLRYLSLQVAFREDAQNNNINDMSSPQIFKHGTPVLNFLRLGNWAMCLFRPPLQSITILDFDIPGRKTISYPTFRGIITSSPHLEHLSINGDIIGRDPWPRRSDVIVLPKLQSLRICGVGEWVYSGILLGFETPMLQSLILRDMRDDDLDELWGMEDNSRYPHLTHLTFQDFDLSPSAYKCVFKTFTEITSFSAPYATFSIETTPLIQFLTDGIVAGQEPPYFPWPKLREVEFNFKDTSDEETILDSMAVMLDIQGRPLSTIRLRVAEEGVEDLVPVQVNAPTICEFVTRDEVWPPNRSFIDYYDTAMG